MNWRIATGMWIAIYPPTSKAGEGGIRPFGETVDNSQGRLTRMIISPAYAQAAEGAAVNPLMQMAPLIFIFVIFYFLLIRPQMNQRKKHLEMVSNVRRGDVVVTAGGIVGKVTKVLEDEEVMVELADNVTVKVVKATISDVRTKPQPPANDSKK